MKKIIKLFDKHSVSVFGAKGTGKDMLFSNVIARRKHNQYISNLDYHVKNKEFIPLDFDALDLRNNYLNFLSHNVIEYEYPYNDNVDIYISDCGVYFPSQYNGELNKKMPNFPTFMALSRHLGNCYVHTNAQNFNRVWDKIREQSDRYIMTLGCFVIGKLVIQKVRIYERYQTALDNISPFKYVSSHLIPSKEENNTILQQKISHQNSYGKIQERILIYFNKTNYDTRFFKGVLKNEK